MSEQLAIEQPKKKRNRNEKVKTDGLMPNQRAFCEAYVNLTSFDIVSAMELAGYNCGDETKRYGRAILAKPEAKEYIAELVAERNAQTQIDKTYVIEKLRKIVDDNADNKTNYNAQLKALELLGDTLGVFKNEPGKVDSSDDAETIVSAAFERRKMKLLKPEDQNGEYKDGQVEQLRG